MRGRVRAWIVACAVLGAAVPASAQIPVTDGLNFSQNLLTQLNTLQVTLNQIEDLANQVQQLQMLAAARKRANLVTRTERRGRRCAPALFIGRG